MSDQPSMLEAYAENLLDLVALDVKRLVGEKQPVLIDLEIKLKCLPENEKVLTEYLTNHVQKAINNAGQNVAKRHVPAEYLKHD